MSNLIFYIFSFIVEAFILWQYTSTLFMPKTVFKTRCLTLVILYFFLFLIALLEFKFINLLLYCVTNFVYLFLQFNLKWYTALFHSALLGSVMAMCELVAYSTLLYFSPNFIAKTNNFHYMVIFATFSKIGFFCIIFLLMHFFKQNVKYKLESDKSSFLFVFILLSSMFIMHTFITIADFYNLPPSIIPLVTLSAILLLLSSLLIFGINQYNQRKNKEFTEMQLLVQKETDLAEYYNMLQTQYDNQQIIIHDIKKHLQSLDLLNQQEEHAKIHTYIQHLLHSSDLKETYRLCEHKLLNSILSRYICLCNDKNISFHIDVRKGTTDFIIDKDLTSLFCNLLDNALESASQLPDSFIELTIRKQENTSFVIISLINSCPIKPPIQKNNILITNKTDKSQHGFGIKSIQKIIKTYNGNMQYYYNDNTLTFHTIITLKKKTHNIF